MAGKIRTAWYIEIIQKLSRRKHPRAAMDLGDRRTDASYKAKNASKRRAQGKKIDLDD